MVDLERRGYVVDFECGLQKWGSGHGETPSRRNAKAGHTSEWHLGLQVSLGARLNARPRRFSITPPYSLPG